ncbi:WYL domain-containing protein [Paenibacillus sp. 598K]|uniref:WYL domain-containing protein n=1 Tax=Paenibacillus sp. 598K TaxID=1117987 RepID=UPI000FFADCEA|nr:WYL domain-containing protein [Paenibacillus sp. 598K]GBF72235.1 WYL domain-containing protein [Paenibacillus sp. 598K]
MNLFEKIFNHQIMTRLEDAGTFTVTSHERAWLKTMLAHPAATEAFAPDTLAKLRAVLAPEEELDVSRHLIEKARSRERQVYHPHLRPLRRLIAERQGVRLTYAVRDDREYTDHPGLPYKLEYSMVKREWYLLWYRLRQPSLMSTRLQKIRSFAAEPLDPRTAERAQARIVEAIAARRTEALIEIVPMYNAELSRILYAFSSFEKTVDYDSAGDIYHVRVSLLGDEIEYLLSKLRFLGRRVRVIEGDYLIHRMRESSAKALARYAEEASPDATEERTS